MRRREGGRGSPTNIQQSDCGGDGRGGAGNFGYCHRYFQHRIRTVIFGDAVEAVVADAGRRGSLGDLVEAAHRVVAKRRASRPRGEEVLARIPIAVGPDGGDVALAVVVTVSHVPPSGQTLVIWLRPLGVELSFWNYGDSLLNTPKRAGALAPAECLISPAGRPSPAAPPAPPATPRRRSPNPFPSASSAWR